MAYCCVPFPKSQSLKSNVSFHEFRSKENPWITTISRKANGKTMSFFSIQNEFANVPAVWKPKNIENLHIVKFWNYINKKYNKNIQNYWDLHKWTIENLAEFWAEIWDQSGIIHSNTYTEVIDLSVRMADAPVWFKGSRTNYAENLLRYRDDHIAIISDGEDKEMKKYTYSDLYLEASRYGAAMKQLGLKANDSVVCYMSNREEAIFAMLGATAAGATWSGTVPLSGSKAAITRFQQVKPKFLFAIDRFRYSGEERDMHKNLKEISHALPSLTKVIIVPSNPSSLNVDISDIPNSCFLNEFLAYGLKADGTVPELEFQQLPFNHPVFINYTSGTTGDPKALIHGPGCLLTSYINLWLCDNTTRNSVRINMSSVGWISWNYSSTMLSQGITLVVYEGLPFYLTPTSLWDMVDKYQISCLFLPPNQLDNLEKGGYVPSEKNHLSSLDIIMSGSSVVKLQNYDFVYTKIKSDVMFGAAYGTTELMGAGLSLNPTLPIYKGEITAPMLGLDARCFNSKGQSVEGERGELVFLKPIPSLPLSILNDEDGFIYRKTYFSTFSGVFAQGDMCLVNPVTKGIIFYGRSDETLKPKGTRFGSVEIYNIVNAFPEIRDSVCVSQYNGAGDERVVLFLKICHGHLFTHDLVLHIRKAIKSGLSEDHVPEVILEIGDIPYNMNGKKMEIIVKKIINKLPYNREIVMNRECLVLYQNIPELQGYV